MRTADTRVAAKVKAEVERRFAHSKKILGAAMTKDNEDALRCADVLEQLPMTASFDGTLFAKTGSDNLDNAAAHLRRLVAENEAKDALLRQAVEALERIDGWLKVRHMGGLMPDEKAIQAAIRQHLEGKA